MVALCFTRVAAPALNASGSRQSRPATAKSIAAKVLAIVPALSRRAL